MSDFEQFPEFDPAEVEQAMAAFDRRTFLKLMGAGLAAAGVTQLGACSKPQSLEKIVPYVRSPENVVPGIPTYYASALPMRGFSSGFGRGVIVESHEGRPTKIEGNPLHPSSLGGADIFMQAAVLQLYDPDRSKTPLRKNQDITWGTLLKDIADFIAERGGPQQVRIALLTSTLTSPTLLAQIEQLQISFPKLRRFIDDPLGLPNTRAGQLLALGRTVTPVYDFTKARRILSLDAHFLFEDAGSLRYAREFAQNRRAPIHALGPNQTHVLKNAPAPAPLTAETTTRLYAIESISTYTGALADHRLAVQPSAVPQLAAELLQMLTTNIPSTNPFIAGVAKDLLAHPGESLILVGEYQPPEVHAAAIAINNLLRAPGNTLRYLEPADPMPTLEADHSLSSLLTALEKNEIDLLFMLDVNPAYSAPADLRAAPILTRFCADPKHLAVHFAAYADETAILCSHHAPLSHPLESWGDLRGHDGAASIVQPLIEPLWQTHSAVEVLASLTIIAAPSPDSTPPFTAGYDLLRGYWFNQWQTLTPAAREIRWRKSLRDGFIADTASTVANLPAPNAQKILHDLQAIKPAAPAGIELAFRPDPAISDGFWANHPWLQELPKPLTQITWDTVALLGPATAAALGIDRPTDPARTKLPMLQITRGSVTLELPAWIQPGHPEQTITLFLGGGRTAPGKSADESTDPVQNGIGVNVNALRTAQSPWSLSATDLHIQKSPRRTIIACTQPTQFMFGRDIARSRPVATLSSEENSPTAPREKVKNIHLSLYNEMPYPGYKWGMVIDLAACIGCSACVIACQAENNIPTVGKEQVWLRREMHWLRIDTYYGAPSAKSIDDFADDPRIMFQPMLCQHCENAPCELVCPVEATSHSSEGINEMTYNRCIGTRYCSNNCPYKVRRFNFLNYNYHDTETVTLESMQKNPNVTVRYRGVMEKCNYCVQRVNRTRIDAKRAWAKSESTPAFNPAPQMRTPAQDPDLPDAAPEPLPRLSLQTACQQSCPTEAILFGDLNDAAAAVTRTKFQAPWQSLNYGVLTELNTQPRTTYMDRLTNFNPALPPNGGAK